jgi:hypothetical protein
LQKKPGTTGQASPSTSEKSPSSTTEAKPNGSQPNSSNSANKELQPNDQSAQQSGSKSQAASGQMGGKQQAQGVNLDPKQRSRVSEAVFSHGNVPRVDHVDFSVRVGTAVPSHVHVVEVPDTLIEIHPAWRGDEYFVVRDEIVIVDHSRKIVAVIPAGDHAASVGSGGSSTTVVDLSPAEIREVQTVLIEKGYLHGTADGKFGPDTREALITFQRKEGIETSGRIDERTVSSLGLSGKIKVGGSQGQHEGGAATTGSGPSMSGQGKSMNGQDKDRSSSDHSNAAPSNSPNATSGQASPNATSGQGSPKAGAKSSDQSSNQGAGSSQPKAGMQPSEKGTTGQGTPSQMQMQNSDKPKDQSK